MQTIIDIVDVLKIVVEVFAIIMGGIWTYYLFIEQRIKYPYVKIEHKINSLQINDDKLLLNVTVLVTNAGKSLVSLLSGMVIVRQVKPIPKSVEDALNSSSKDDLREGRVAGLFLEKGRRINWDEVGYRKLEWEKGEVTIEPGESEEFQLDFILDAFIKAVEIISYFKKAKRFNRETGWRLTSFYNVENPK